MYGFTYFLGAIKGIVDGRDVTAGYEDADASVV